MNRDFWVGISPLHDGEVLRLGLRQLAESEILLRKLLAAYQKSRSVELEQEIARECSFISQTLDTLINMATRQSGSPDFTVSGCLLKVSRYLRQLVERADKIVADPEESQAGVV